MSPAHTRRFVIHNIMRSVTSLHLYQHVNEPTHYRALQHPNTLDLVITNEEDIVDNLSLSAPVGKSHHVCIHFDFTCYTEPPPRNVTKWYCLKNNINYLMNKYIPKSRPNQKKRPIFLNAKASEKIKEIKMTFRRWRETCSPQDYKKYTKARN